MNVYLMRHTADPDLLCGEAAALCTAFKGDPMRALNGAMLSGHESVAEHATFTFLVEGVSRVLLAQLTRHRLSSFSVQSQRYVSQTDTHTVIPPSVMLNPEAHELVKLHVMNTMRLYENLIELGIPQEDARYILHQGVETRLILTMNVRELRHFFSLRCCNRAQWEIRVLADEMLKQCKQAAPALFWSAGPGCVCGACEEARPCGNPRKRDEWNQ